MKKTDLTPAAAYIRMSTDKQDTSPDQQRGELVKLAAKHGCRIAAEYLDEGISGVETKKRAEFLRLIADAEAGKFKVILCWDQDRFSRFDMLTAAQYWGRLRDAGVRIITCTKGELDFSSIAGFLTASVDQHGKHEFLLTLSKNVVRSVNEQGERGEWRTRPPFGYDRGFWDNGRLVVDASGNVVRAGKGFHKPNKAWQTRLVPSVDGSADVIRWIFETFCQTDTSVRNLSLELMKRGTPAPDGGRIWAHIVLQRILQNPAYMGDTINGQHARGRGKFNQAQRHEVRDTHQPIVSRELWARAQQRLAERKMKPRRAKSNSPWLLSGVLRCGCCGGPMKGTVTVNRYRRKHRYYACSTAQRGHGCKQHGVPAEMLEECAMKLIQENLLESDLDKFRAEIVKAAKAKRSPKEATRQDGLRKQIDKLTKQIDKARENIMLMDPADIPEANALLAKWREQRDELRSTLTLATAPTADVDALVAKAESFIQDVREGLQGGNPAVTRDTVRKLLKSFTIYWKESHQTKSGRTRWRASQGVAEFCLEAHLACLTDHKANFVVQFPTPAKGPESTLETLKKLDPKRKGITREQFAAEQGCSLQIAGDRLVRARKVGLAAKAGRRLWTWPEDVKGSGALGRRA